MGAKILTVDDSELILRMYALMLGRFRREGAEVLQASNGVEAFAQLAEHPDTGVILLDLDMPGMGGLEFLEKVKAQPRLAAIPVIVISVEGAVETSRVLEAGAAACLSKPFHAENLRSLVDQYLH